MKTTIIIPNYNGLSFMEPCFEALDRQTTKDFKILVVDNGSTDGSVEWLKEKQIPSIFLPENTGFSGAVNVGIKAADTPYVILLNNDTKVAPHYVEALERAMDRSEKIFSVSSKMIQMYHPDLMDDAGDMYSVLGWAFQRGVGRPEGLYKKSCRVFTACAGAAIYRREFLEKTGLFDEEHFAYLEDTDIGYRARLFGYENWYEPAAKVYHVGSGTSGSRYNLFKIRYSSRNNIYLIYKNMPVLQILFNLPAFVLGFTAKLVFFASKGYGKEYLAGVKNGFSICRKPENKAKKIRFCWKLLGTYLVIEWELFLNVFRRFLDRA